MELILDIYIKIIISVKRIILSSNIWKVWSQNFVLGKFGTKYFLQHLDMQDNLKVYIKY